MDTVRRLIHRAQKNDLAAFEELVLLYQDRVFALAVRLLGNQADAQDLAQEVFIRAYRSLPGFRGEADFGTWLHRIAVNLWLNGRRRGNVSTVSLDQPLPTGEGEVLREVPTLEGEPESMLMERELGELLQESLDALPKEQKAVLVLRELEGQTYEEIAAVLKCSLGTVRSRLSRARQALRRQVAERARRAGVPATGWLGAACALENHKPKQRKEGGSSEL